MDYDLSSVLVIIVVHRVVVSTALVPPKHSSILHAFPVYYDLLQVKELNISRSSPADAVVLHLRPLQIIHKSHNHSTFRMKLNYLFTLILLIT